MLMKLFILCLMRNRSNEDFDHRWNAYMESENNKANSVVNAKRVARLAAVFLIAFGQIFGEIWFAKDLLMGADVAATTARMTITRDIGAMLLMFAMLVIVDRKLKVLFIAFAQIFAEVWFGKELLFGADTAAVTARMAIARDIGAMLLLFTMLLIVDRKLKLNIFKISTEKLPLLPTSSINFSPLPPPATNDTTVSIDIE